LSPAWELTVVISRGDILILKASKMDDEPGPIRPLKLGWKEVSEQT
jgi:hypothetical protein